MRSFLVLFASALTLAVVAPPDARALCGDPNGDGVVSVTSGVQILRHAAGLTSRCTPAICDVDLNGAIGVTDGVQTLRAAAGIASIALSCAEEQIPVQIGRFGVVTKIPAIAAARAAGTAETVACPDGGFTEVTPDFLEDFDCNRGGRITNGRISFVEQGGDVLDLVFSDYTARDVATGQQAAFTGSLRLTFADAQKIDLLVNGPMQVTSTALGGFTDRLTDVRYAVPEDAPARVISGAFRTEVTSGSGPYANLVTLDTSLFATGLRVSPLAFASGATVTIVDPGESRLCDACTPNVGCGPGLGCRSCVGDCTGDGPRCAIGDPPVTCADGRY